WTARGGAATGKDGLALAPGQAVEHRLAAPVAAGRVGVNFRTGPTAAGTRWLVELTFDGKPLRTVRVTVAGAGPAVEATGLEGTAGRVARAEGWRRLSVAFGPGSLRVSVDEDALWSSFTAGPGGALRQVALRAVMAGNQAATGAVTWSALALERAVD